MNSHIEAKYINIIWQDRHTAIKIVEAIEPIEIKKLDTNKFELEAINYSKIDNGKQGLLAFRLLDEKTSNSPYFLLENGSKVALVPFQDNKTKKVWWIDGDNWDQKSNRWHSRIYRSVGDVSLYAGENSYVIHISTSSFTYEQLEEYLEDFRNDLWELILDDSSYVRGAGRISNDQGIDESTLKAVIKYLGHVEVVLKKSKVELKEVQKLSPRRSVKPVPRTFMELATKGDGKYLTSRASVESKDVPENRYVHFTLKRVYLILRVLTSVTGVYASTLEKNIREYQKRLDAFSDSTEINEEAVRYDLWSKCEHFESLNPRLRFEVEALLKSNEDTEYDSYVPWSLVFSLGKKAEILGSDTYFASVREPNSHDWFDPSRPDFVTVEFDSGIAVASGFDYLVKGHIANETRAYNNKTRFAYTVYKIDSIEIIGGRTFDALKNAIEQTKRDILKLESTNWLRALTPQELTQQAKEIVTVEKVLSMLEQKQRNMMEVNKVIAPKLPVTKKLLMQFERAQIQTNSVFPDSMTFVQNPSYQGVHTQFKIIKALAGVDDDELLLAFERIDNLALVNISNLYERWCLVQIIKVLLQKFGYQPQQDWKRLLVKQVLDRGTNISLEFKNDEVARTITLWYEKELENGNRPDFILDVEALSCESSETLKKRFVMDAKFYQDIDHKRHGGISTVIKEMYVDKDYSEHNQNSVFILHPSKGAVPIRKTPQLWAGSSFYGEVPMFDWDDELRRERNHDYGAIYLSPIGQDNYLDELQRLIGMFLQYGIEADRTTYQTAAPEGKIFCMSCGSDKYSYAKGKNSKVGWITCSDCSHFTTYNYCGGCGNKLIKNGEHWTYHSTEPLHPLNIKCPKCQNLL